MITEIDDFFSRGCGRCDRFDTPACSAMTWAPGLAELRRICLAAGLQETVKWGHPCYMHADRNIAIIGAHRGDYRITFFNGELMKDPEGVLERQGPNSRTADAIRMTERGQAAALEPVIAAYLAEAKSYAEAGIKPTKTENTVDLPDELIEALDADPDLAEAFHRLTRGRQNSYAINLNAAKTPATRYSRIQNFRDKIMAGKGALER